MIHGIGTDIVAIARIEGGLARFGERFAEKILAPDEMKVFASKNKQAHFLAKRFAAKEAAVKALGTGFAQGISMHHVQVRNNAQGKPELFFSDKAAQIAEEMAVGESQLSISDEQHYAIAFVILLKRL